MAEVTLDLTKMSSPYDYANWDPDDPWTRKNYVKLRLDRRTLEELDHPEKIEVVVRSINDNTKA